MLIARLPQLCGSDSTSSVGSIIDFSGIQYANHGMYWGSSMINLASIQEEKVWQLIENTNMTITVKSTQQVLIAYNILVEGLINKTIPFYSAHA